MQDLNQEETEKKEKWIKNMRAAVDWIEANPITAPITSNLSIYSYNTKDEAREIARLATPIEKRYDSNFARLIKRFSNGTDHIGTIEIDFTFYRDAICRKVETTVEVPETIVPAKNEEVIPAHTKTEVTWICDEPLLSTEEAPSEY